MAFLCHASCVLVVDPFFFDSVHDQHGSATVNSGWTCYSQESLKVDYVVQTISYLPL